MTELIGLPFSAWPAEDRAVWDHSVRSAGLFEEAGVLADRSPVTRRELRATYGYFLGFLVSEGVDIACEPISCRITPERLRGWVLANQDRLSISSQSVYAERLLTVLRAGFPQQDLSLLETASRNLSRKAKREGRHDLSEPLPDAPTLLKLGRDLIARAETGGGCTSVPDAETWRDGFAIRFLIHHPVRARNLSELVLGETLLKTSDGYRISIPGTQTKTGKPIDVGVAPDVGLLLDRYLAEIHPLFPTPTRHQGRLWLTRRGTALAAKGLGRRIGDVTETELGIRVSPHAFRRIAANTLIVTEGADPGDASALLGHADPRTTRRHYITAGSLEISRRYGNLVKGLLREPGSRQRKRKAAS